jgi:hypothetical protein
MLLGWQETPEPSPVSQHAWLPVHPEPPPHSQAPPAVHVSPLRHADPPSQRQLPPLQSSPALHGLPHPPQWAGSVSVSVSQPVELIPSQSS